MVQRILKSVVILTVVSACVDPIVFETPPPTELLVIDGMIADEPGPYRVKISRGVALDRDSTHHAPVSGVKITLHDDEGRTENFAEIRTGEYHTGGVIRGRAGHSYYITIRMPDGSVFESEPEKILPTGEIKTIRHEFEARTAIESFGVKAADVFNVYIDADAPTTGTDLAYVRWRSTGTYKVETNPERHKTYLQGEFYYMTPYPCSGWVVKPALNGGQLEKDSECTCCTCWVKHFEPSPQMSDTELVSGGQFRNLKVGEVPITSSTFFDKFHVEVEQMTISRNAFEFFKLIRAQKEGASSLFQPPSGRLIGNIRSSDAPYPVVGLFWAASIHRKSMFLSKSEVPYTIAPIDLNTEPCTAAYANSTTTKPAFWDE